MEWTDKEKRQRTMTGTYTRRFEETCGCRNRGGDGGGAGGEGEDVVRSL